ncbi:MAG: GntR family transcriptional regulator, partial [Rhodoferax sp.]|nr:GntR family transcriptional regulator [Rhodoferax sp.]MCB2056699.1 GntR family transcriptional regulator [Novosphingobium sp.]
MSSQIERVVTELRGRILSGQLPAGHRVVELQFAQELAVSRTPLRLALGELEKEGLLERLPTRGFKVRAFTL